MNNAGFTLSALWTIRDIPRGVLGGNAKSVLNALVSFANQNGHIEVDAVRLSSAADLGKTTLMREIERLCLLGVVTIVRRGIGSASSIYRIEMVRLSEMKSVDAPPVRSQSPRGVSLKSSNNGVVSPGSYSERGEELPRVGNQEFPGLDAGGSGLGTFEEEEDQKEDLLEDNSPSIATSQAFAVSPSTARSPATMPPAQEALLTPTPTKQKKPRATKPKLAPLTVEALTPDERAVHDAIVQDVTLSQICHNVPQLSRDLVAIAAGRIDVVAKVKALAVWNRNNPTKAWTTAGGNRGLTSCVTKDASQTSYPCPSTRSSANVAPANATPASPPPAIVDLAKHPELAPRPMRSARF